MSLLSSEDNSPAESGLREVRYEYSENLVPLLTQMKASLLVSTYQAGKLVTIGVHDGALQLSFLNFEQAMGVAVSRNQIAVGGKDWIYFLKKSPELALQVEPAGTHDACFLIRGAQYTSDISVHEVAWGHEQLILTNTRFSCLCKLHNDYSFVPQWRPPFVSALAPEDRCHLNGLALLNGRPKYVTVLGQTDVAGGWRQDKVKGGCLLDLPSGEVVASGLAMPHSPRVAQERVWILNSGLGELSWVDVSAGRVEPVVGLSGYPRGLAIAGRIAFVGLSKARETETFGNLPISDRLDALKCGVAIVDLQGGRQVGFLEFKSGVDEIFDVQLLPGYRHPFLLGPHASKEGSSPIWLVPSV